MKYYSIKWDGNEAILSENHLEKMANRISDTRPKDRLLINVARGYSAYCDLNSEFRAQKYTMTVFEKDEHGNRTVLREERAYGAVTIYIL